MPTNTGARAIGTRGPPAKAAVAEPTVSAIESSNTERRILTCVIGTISCVIMNRGLVSSAIARSGYGGFAHSYVSAITLLISVLPIGVL